MRKVHFFFTVFLFSSAFFLGCGDRFKRVDTIRGFTKVTVDTANFSSVEAVPVLGTLVYAIDTSTSFRQIHFVPNGQTMTTFTLPNSSYRFLALGYDTAPMSNVSCYHIGPYTLDGTASSYTLTPDPTACTDTNLTNLTTGTMPAPLRIYLCDVNSELLTGSNKTINTLNCTYPKSTSANAFSVKVLVNDDDSVSPQGFNHGCSNLMASTGEVNPTYTASPANSTLPQIPDRNIKVTINVYSGSNCSAGALIHKIVAIRGLEKLDAASTSFAFDEGNNTDYSAKIRSVTGDYSGTLTRIFINL